MASVAAAKPKSRARWVLPDAMAVTQRNLIGLIRIPQALFFATVQPVMFVLLFRYVFGGAIKVPGINYVDYLMPGVFVQTMLFGGIQTSIGLSEDLHKGLIERFQALPMARSAVLAGRTTADLVRNLFVVTVISLVGFGVGFRVHTNFFKFLGGVALILAFAYAVGWAFALIGLSAANPETAQTMAFPIIFPLVFVSSAFVPTKSLPAIMKAFADNQPVTQVINATRALTIGEPALRIIGHSTGSLVLRSLAWTVGILVVFVPLAVRRYKSAVV